MAWTNSKVFTAFGVAVMDRTTPHDLDTDVPKVALYNNTPTPDQTVAAASTAYNVGQWVTANEVFEAGQWAQGGVVLAGHDVTSATTTITWDANDTQSGSAADLANVFGALVYNDTMTTVTADAGICYNYLGGANSVVNGTFTVVWAVAGIMSLSTA